MPRPLSRRRFLSSTLPALGAGAVAPAFLGSTQPGPLERLRLAWIGCGGRGRQLGRIFDGFADTEIAFACDVHAARMDRMLEELRDGRGQRPEKVKDYRTLLARKDVDAIVLATCEHWHGLPFIEACQAGKPIYVEKPLAHTVREGRRMVEAARRAGIVALMGTQQRAGSHFQEAVEIVRSGRLGAIAHVDCWNYHDIDRGGRPADRDPPPELDWERWLGPAPRVSYNPLRLDYSWWFDYGGGMMTNWNVHHADTVLWAMGSAAPARVHAGGGLLATGTLSDAPDLVDAVWQFPSWVMRYHYKGFSNHHPYPARPHHHGIVFAGTEATLHLDRHGYALYEVGEPSRPVNVVPRSEQDGPWQRHFVDCVLRGARPAVTLEESHQATVLCLLANISHHVKRSIAWDVQMETIPLDAEAAALLERPRRKGYELPEA